MELNEYPRPANDTGIGIHWTVGYANAVGMATIRDFWIPEMKAMGVKWVKVFNHDGALDFCELLLAEGFMPIVRLYRPSPNPGRLGVKELVHLDALIRAGVRYFEFNNEPDVDAEWKGGRVPVNGLEITVENTIAALEVILERGGMPAIPAVANGSRWDLVGRLVAAGRRDLLDGPVWQALHNYARNRPLDYPYDIGNQEGAAFTERFYRAVAAEPWGEDAWRGRSLSEVNRLRFDRRNPGATIMDDHACWLAYEYFDALNRKHLGRSIPILSTECGYIVGEDSDPRYAATTPDLHMAQILEACRIMMGTSQRFKHAPDYYFCSAFWLLANEKLGSTSTWWEGHAWYSERWPGGSLPIVRALRGEPKRSRLPGEVAAPRIALRGTVAQGGDERQLIAEQDGVEVARAMLDEDGYFELTGLSPGRYVLHLANTALRETVELRPDQQEVVVRLALAAPVEVISRSVVTGTVNGGAGAVIMLVQKASGEEWVTMAKDDGGYRFIDLPPGEYSLRVHPAGTQLDSIKLDGRNTIEADLALAGWGYTVRSAGAPLKAGAIVVTTPGYKGLHVQVHGQDWASDPVETGTAPEYGDEACLITPLDEGHYIVTVNDAPEAGRRQIQLEARAFVDKRSFPLIEFVYTDLEAEETPHASAVVGRVLGRRSGEPVQVILIDDRAQRTEQTVDTEGRFAFHDLLPGRYAVAIAGFEASTTEADIALDGRNEVRVELTLPAESAPPAPSIVEKGAASVIAGIAPDAAGRQARLVDAVGNEHQQAVDAAGRVCFDRLPAGSYSLFIDGGYVENKIAVDGVSSSEVHFAPLVTVWESSTVQAGSMPGFSVLRVEVEGMASLPVRVVRSTDDAEAAPQEWTASTLAVPERGTFVAEFKPLGPGLYLVEPEGLGVHTTVELSGLEAVWVTFRRRSQPVHANVVQSRTGAQAGATGLAGEARAPSVYLYIAGLPQDLAMQMALLRLTAEVKPEVGSDFAAALQADRVLLFAPEHVAEIQAEFLAKGVEVEVVNERLRQLAAELGG